MTSEPYLTNDEMNFLRKIRRDYAQAVRALSEHKNLATQEAYEEARERRNRAIRSLGEDGFSPRQIAAMLMCSKNYVKAALESNV